MTGRLTSGRAAAAGAAGGAWFGLLIGLLMGLFAPGPVWLGLILGGVFRGALWGAVPGWTGHAATGGRRDFSSTRALAAARYDLGARGDTRNRRGSSSTPRARAGPRSVTAAGSRRGGRPDAYAAGA
ncbi:hypothetical protein [Streptomyces sp. NPDC006274]|uniref:hypothetical protein n=1 Tax=unclassified Streptomyces TaxID=2593676 RepID=UPI00339FC3A1